MRIMVPRPYSQPEGLIRLFVLASIFMILFGVIAYMLLYAVAILSFIQWYLLVAVSFTLTYVYAHYFYPEWLSDDRGQGEIPSETFINR